MIVSYFKVFKLILDLLLLSLININLSFKNTQKLKVELSVVTDNAGISVVEDVS